MFLRVKEIRDQIKKRLKDEEGLTSLEAVIGTLIFIMVFVTLMDLMLLSNRFSTLTDTGKDIARTLSVQGGALDEKPVGYASNYYTIDKLSTLTKRNMQAAGFDDEDWYVVVEYDHYYDESEPDNPQSVELSEFQQMTIMKSDGTYQATPKIDYLSNFRVIIHAKYKWNFIRLLFPVKSAGMSVTMPGMSEWKYNYDAWPSET